MLIARHYRGRGAAVVAALVASCFLTACDPTGTKDGQTSGNSEPSSEVVLGGCPETIEERVGETAATEEIDLGIDASRSFVSNDAAMSVLLTQVNAIVDKAIDQEAALRISVFTSTVSTTLPVINCSTMSVARNNDDTLPQRKRQLKAVAHEEITQAIAVAITKVRTDRGGQRGPGTSVVGGWLMLTSIAPVKAAAGQREAVMLSDAKGIPTEVDVPVDLSGFNAVSLYGVGRSDRRTDTTTTAELVKTWIAWLLAHGAAAPVVSPGTYS